MASVEVKEKSREPEEKPQEKKEELKALRGGGAACHLEVLRRFLGMKFKNICFISFQLPEWSTGSNGNASYGGGTAFSEGR